MRMRPQQSYNKVHPLHAYGVHAYGVYVCMHPHPRNTGSPTPSQGALNLAMQETPAAELSRDLLGCLEAQNGWQFFGSAKTSRRQHAVVTHANWMIGEPTKRACLQAAGLWFVSSAISSPKRTTGAATITGSATAEATMGGAPGGTAGGTTEGGKLVCTEGAPHQHFTSATARTGEVRSCRASSTDAHEHAHESAAHFSGHVRMPWKAQPNARSSEGAAATRNGGQSAQ